MNPVTIAERRLIAADQGTVWQRIADFGSEHRWSSALAACHRDTQSVAVGTVRHCTLSRPLLGRRAVSEELTEFVAPQALGYRLRGGAGPFRTAAGRWVLRPSGGCTVVEVFGTFQPHNMLVALLFGRLARAAARRAARQALHDLADSLT